MDSKSDLIINDNYDSYEDNKFIIKNIKILNIMTIMPFAKNLNT